MVKSPRAVQTIMRVQIMILGRGTAWAQVLDTSEFSGTRGTSPPSPQWNISHEAIFSLLQRDGDRIPAHGINGHRG